jgi:hypothetical protein
MKWATELNLAAIETAPHCSVEELADSRPGANSQCGGKSLRTNGHVQTATLAGDDVLVSLRGRTRGTCHMAPKALEGQKVLWRPTRHRDLASASFYLQTLETEVGRERGQLS